MARQILFLLRDRTSLIWLGLIVATLLSWAMGTHQIGGLSNRAAGMGVLAVGFLKARYIGLDFMETRHAPVAIRILMEAWSVCAFLVLATLFLLG